MTQTTPMLCMAALVAATFVLSAGQALAGDSTSIVTAPVGSQPLHAASAGSADRSDTLLQSGDYVDASQLNVATSKTANYAPTAGYAPEAGNAQWSATAQNLGGTGKIDASRIEGTVASAAYSVNAGMADTAAKANQLYNNWVGAYDWASNLRVARADSAGGADRANQLYNNYTGGYDWASNLRVGRADSSGWSDSAGTADRANQLFNNYTGVYDWASNLRVGRADSSGRSDSSAWADNSAGTIVGYDSYQQGMNTCTRIWVSGGRYFENCGNGGGGSGGAGDGGGGGGGGSGH